MAKEIFKLQSPLMTSEKVPTILVYNEDRSYEGRIPMNKELSEIIGPNHKTFVYGIVRDGTIHIEEDAPWQDW